MSRSARVVLGSCVVLLAVALVVLPGCTSGSKESDSTSTGNPLVSKIETSTTPPAKLIAAEEVAKISGITGVKTVPRGENKQASGDLNFANDKGGVFLTIVLGTSEQYDAAAEGTTYGKKAEGVGDDSYIGPSETVSKTPNMFVFKKGNDSVALTTFFSGPDKTVLTVDQLKQIASTIAPRL